MTRMDANCEEFRSLRMAYQVAQRLVCLKYSNQGDDYIREELRKLKEGLCCRPANMRNRMFSARIRLV